MRRAGVKKLTCVPSNRVKGQVAYNRIIPSSLSFLLLLSLFLILPPSRPLATSLSLSSSWAFGYQGGPFPTHAGIFSNGSLRQICVRGGNRQQNRYNGKLGFLLPSFNRSVF